MSTRTLTGFLCLCALGLSTAMSCADGPKDVKIIASVSSVGDVPKIPITIDPKKTEPWVFRSPAELAASLLEDEKKSQLPEEQTKAGEWAAKLLKVERIDWDKQMLLCIRDRTYRMTHEVKITSVKAGEKVMAVTYRVPLVEGPDTLNTPTALILVPKFEGTVRFEKEDK